MVEQNTPKYINKYYIMCCCYCCFVETMEIEGEGFAKGYTKKINIYFKPQWNIKKEW